ncbi:uncharacterized protein LOC111079473 [Drosophila obscura]|uniref:uncharacterized protein LOC111079473 n=1 Tax=Drosophila obscura TaxID=7282 RepID=UPI001BB125D4|nr:uncharacterized protein LOC111079473 [Drosophila obscura]
MALKKKAQTKASPKKRGKGKSSPVLKKKKPQKVPKSSPKQQSQLKTLFRASKFKTTSQGNPVKRQAPVPPKQRVWRKTIVRNKPKKKEVKLPRLFRADRRTGLPVDYERTVEHVMHYVNPYIGSRRKRTPEEELEEVMTRMFVELIQQGGAHQDPCHIAQQLRSMLQKGQCNGIGKGNGNGNGKGNGQCIGNCNCQLGEKCTKSPRSDGRRENAELSDFYSACKRGPPATISPLLGPTRKSRFNYNQLKIRSI